MDMTLWAQSRRDKAFKVALLLFLLSFSDYISEQLKVSLRYLLTFALFLFLPCLRWEDNSHFWHRNLSITCKATTWYSDALVRNVSQSSRVEPFTIVI